MSLTVFSADVSKLQAVLIISIAVFAVIKFVCFIYAKRPGQRKLPPGPRGWPVLGIIPMLIRAEREGTHTHTVMTELSRKYGGVFSFKLGQKLVVCLNTLESIKEAFNNIDICDRDMALLDSISEYSGKGVISSSGKVWWHHRRFLMTVFRKFDIGKTVFEERIIDEVSYLSGILAEYSSEPFHLGPLLGNASANTVSSVLFGKHYDYKENDFQELLKHIRTVIEFIGAGGKVFFLPPFIVKYVINRKGYQEYFKSFSAIRHLFRNIIEEHKKHDVSEEDMHDMVDAYLVEMSKSETAEGSCFTHDNLEANMADLVGAAFDTTMNTLLWAFLYMITYPDIQSRVQDELDSVLGRNVLPRRSDIAKLPFTEATLLEVQRIQTTIPMGGQHSTSKDTTIQGFDIPKGTVVLSNLWHVHHDPEIWNDPEVFRPERFIDQDGKVIVPPHFIPFSTGRRSCLGEKMAKAELFYFFTHLLHRFTFSTPKNAPEIPFIGLPGLSYGPPYFEVCAIRRS